MADSKSSGDRSRKRSSKPASGSKRSGGAKSSGQPGNSSAPKRSKAAKPAAKRGSTTQARQTQRKNSKQSESKKQATKNRTAAATPASEQAAAKQASATTKGTRQAVTSKTTADQQSQQEANRKLWMAYGESRSEELREEIILQYAPLVKYVMGRLAISLPAVLDYEDILSFGTIGLIEAVERFDYEKGVKFETYAIARIRGAIIDALRSLDRLPRSVRQKAKDADKALVDLSQDLGRDPTDEEVAEAMGLTVQAYRKHLIDASWVTVSLDTMGTSNDGDEDSGGALGIADPDDEDFSVGLEQQELVGELAGAIRELPEREQLILSLYYKEELTMREVSKVLSISESRVCQLHARALTRLRGSITRMQEGRAA
jgi:RNA polymerase sigma factor for flagellar operon FliA